MQTKLGHIQFNVAPGNVGFYRDLMTFLGWQVLHDGGEEILGVGDANGVSLWFAGQVKPVGNDYDGPGMNHLGIGAASQADVDAAGAFLVERGVALLFGTPRHNPEYSDETNTYYQIMFETPDRILLEVVYTGPKEA